MFIATLRTRKGLIVSASVLSVLLHAGLIWLLPQFKSSAHQANVAPQKTLSVKLSATATVVPDSNSLASEAAKLKSSQAEVMQETKVIQQTKKQPETKNLKPALSEVAKSSHVKPDIETPAAVEAPKPEVTTTQVQSSEKIHKIIQVQETAKAQVASSKQEPKQEPKQETASKKASGKPRYQLGSKANPNPDYPMLARKKGWQGEVVLGVHVAADGSIQHLSFVKSTDYGVLNYAAYETVRNHWRFDPLLNQSEELSAYIEVPITFRFN